MDLIGIRQEFVKKSGRYDLVTDPTTWADNGADFYINAGQRMVDKMLTSRNKLTYVDVSIAAGKSVVDTKLTARVIKSVEVVDADNVTVALTYKDRGWLQYEYGRDFEYIDTGVPYYWTYTIGDEVDSARTLTVLPPVSEACTVRVIGWFTTPDLIYDADTSIWTTDYPDILLKAALCQLESFYRNTEGYNDYMAAIKMDVQLLDFEDVDDVSSQVSEFEG